MERRRAPAAPPQYGRRRFWDELYRREGAETREWLGGLSRFLPQLEPELRPGDRILVLGCGNSALSHDLHELGYTDVTSIDFSAACIAAMRARYARCPGLRWAVMDIRALAFPDASFDVVLEKGTLDVLLVEETDPWHVSPQAAAAMHRVLAEVSRVLRPGGCFISITFAQPHFRKPHYAQEAFGWSLRHAACGDGDAGAFHYFLYVMRKGQPLEPRDVALGRRLHQPPPGGAPPPPPPPPRRPPPPRTTTRTTSSPSSCDPGAHPPPSKALRCSILTGGRQGTGASLCELPSGVGDGSEEGDAWPPLGGTGTLW